MMTPITDPLASAEELAERMRRRKYQRGCLRKLSADERSFYNLTLGRWCIDLGDSRPWFGATAMEAWKRYAIECRVSGPYRGPRE